MPEVKDAPQIVAPETEKIPGNIVSRGPSTKATVVNAVKQDEPPAASTETKPDDAASVVDTPPTISDDQVKEFLKGKGIELDDTGIDGLKEKLKPAPAAQDPADIEKQKAADEAAFEKRMLDFYTAGGGSIEDFVALKEIAGADLKALSEVQIKREMKAAGFDDDEIAAVIKERYYQLNPEELEQGVDESDEDFAKRKTRIEKSKTHFSKKLETKSSHIKKQAEDALSTLREAIKSQDKAKEEEIEDSKRVDEFFTKLPKTVTVDLGKAEDGQDIPPINYNIPEDVIAEVQATLKDPAKRKQFLFNEDNSLNLDNVANSLLRNKILEAALKETHITAEKRGSEKQVAIFEKTFPGRTAKDIGVGGATSTNQNARKGHIVERGKSEPVRR